MSRRAAVAATTSLLAVLAGAAPAQAALSGTPDCSAVLRAGALLTTTVVPASSAQLVGTSTRTRAVRVDAQTTDPSGAKVYHLRPGTVLEVRVAQGAEVVSRTDLAGGGWVRATDVAPTRSLARCALRLG